MSNSAHEGRLLKADDSLTQGTSSPEGAELNQLFPRRQHHSTMVNNRSNTAEFTRDSEFQKDLLMESVSALPVTEPSRRASRCCHGTSSHSRLQVLTPQELTLLAETAMDVWNGGDVKR